MPVIDTPLLYSPCLSFSLHNCHYNSIRYVTFLSVPLPYSTAYPLRYATIPFIQLPCVPLLPILYLSIQYFALHCVPCRYCPISSSHFHYCRSMPLTSHDFRCYPIQSFTAVAILDYEVLFDSLLASTLLQIHSHTLPYALSHPRRSCSFQYITAHPIQYKEDQLTAVNTAMTSFFVSVDSLESSSSAESSNLTIPTYSLNGDSRFIDRFRSFITTDFAIWL